jgi:tetratricopeptide (TPR) repeat protein
VPNLRIFQGREDERSDLNTWLADPSVSMIGIRGEGGIGKSMLMAKVFAESQGFAGKFWVDVRTGTSIAALAERALQEFGALPEQVRSLEEKDLIRGLLRQLQQGRYLLAIDNLESVLTTEGNWRGGYEDFLDGFQNLGSESVLLLAGREYPQKYPGWRHSRWLTLEQGLKPIEGAALLECLEVADTLENRATVSEQVHGNPLALSLIAGWLRDEYRQPEERLVRHLSQHTDLFQLEGKHRGESNISVDRVLQWSFDRLTSTQRYLLTQVSVLRGAFDAELATALVLEPPVSDAYLHDLERRSLLQERPKPKPDGQRLFQLQPRIREFVKKQAHDLTTAHERAIDYFRTRCPVMWIVANISREQSADYLERFKNKFPNIPIQDSSKKTVSPHEETFYHQCQLKQHARAFETLRAYDGFLSPQGYYKLQINLYSQLYNDWQPSSEELRDYGMVCEGMGGAHLSLGQYQRALEFYQQSLEIMHQIGDHKGEAGVRKSFGDAYNSLGQYQQAIAFYQQSLQIIHEIDNSSEQRLCQREEEAGLLIGLGAAHLSLGEYQQALNSYEQALKLVREISNQLPLPWENSNSPKEAQKSLEIVRKEIVRKRTNRGCEGSALLGLGNTHYSLGDHHQALDFYQKALEIMRETCDRGGEAAALDSLGVIHHLRGQDQQAIDCHQRSLKIMREIGSRRGEAKCVANLGNAYKSPGQYQQAITCYQQALEITREISDREDEAKSLVNLGSTYGMLGQYQQAITYYQQALEITREIGSRLGEAMSLGGLGKAYCQLEKYQRSIDCLQNSLKIRREIGDRVGEANILFDLGWVLVRFDQRFPALQMYNQALVLYEELKLDNAVEKCKSAIARINQIDAIRPSTAPSIGIEKHNDDDWYAKSLPTKRNLSASPSSRQTQNWWLWLGVGLTIALLIWWLR